MVIVTEFFVVGVNYKKPTMMLVTCQDNMVKAKVMNKKEIKTLHGCAEKTLQWSEASMWLWLETEIFQFTYVSAIL